MSMTYVDGFVIPIKKTKLKAYKRMAQWGKRSVSERQLLQLGGDVGRPRLFLL